ncbi:MAG: sigma-70 family RNA polymerase sigma factor [Polyangiaceae bacterium]
MSAQVVALGARRRIDPQERQRFREVSAIVSRALRVLSRQGRAALPMSDLQAMGMFGVWKKLPTYDSARSSFESWAFFHAYHSMLDGFRDHQRETTFETAVRSGMHAYIAHDERAPEADFHTDTPETDFRRLRLRAQRLAAAAWIQAHAEAPTSASPEREIVATEAVRIVREEVARLSEEQRTYVHLRFWDDSEVRDVAVRMGVPERTLRRRWLDARDLLAARLRARGIHGVPDGFDTAVDALSAAEQEPS